MNRRKFIKSTTVSTIGASLFTGLYSWKLEPSWVEFVIHEMPINNLPDHLIGKTLMQISDLHIGDDFDYGYIIDSFIKSQNFEPDFVVYTGDYVSYINERQFKQLDQVLEHTVRGKLGTLGILGNHDYGHEWAEQDVADQITSQLEHAGIQVLLNESSELHGLNFIGLEDFWSKNFYPKEIMKAYDTSKAFITLCHNPDACDLSFWDQHNYSSWILSGHTHGGQCKPPFLPPPVIPVKNKRYSTGEISLTADRKLYINRAIGHMWPLRFNVRPEITIFNLSRA